MFPWDTTNVKNAAGGLPTWEVKVGQVHLSCPGVSLSQEPWEHSWLMNIFVREIIVGFPNYVCIPCARVACDLELKFWVTLCVVDFNIFAAWWFAVLEFDKINECSPQKKKCTEAQMHAIYPWTPVKSFCSGDLYHFSSLDGYLKLEKWFIVNTLVQSNKEVWTFVSSCSFTPPGSSTSSGRLLSGPLSFFYHVYQRHYRISLLPTSFFSVLLAATYYSKTSTPTCPHL